MYKTEITVNGKVIPIEFGTFVVVKLEAEGLTPAKLGEEIESKPYSTITKIFYYGALNASENRAGKDISMNDIYDWLDKQPGGLLGQNATEIRDLFIAQMTDHVVTENQVKGTKKK